MSPISQGTLTESLAEAACARLTAEMRIRELVDHGRREGLSWALIGATLGMSKQAAQQRYSPARLRAMTSTARDAGHVQLGVAAALAGILAGWGTSAVEIIGYLIAAAS